MNVVVAPDKQLGMNTFFIAAVLGQSNTEINNGAREEQTNEL